MTLNRIRGMDSLENLRDQLPKGPRPKPKVKAKEKIRIELTQKEPTKPIVDKGEDPDMMHCFSVLLDLWIACNKAKELPPEVRTAYDKSKKVVENLMKKM